MSDFEQLQKALEEAQGILAKYSEGGVASAASMSGQLSDTSSMVLMTDGVKRRKKDKIAKRSNVKSAPDVPDQKVKGIKTTSSGKRIPVVGLSAKDEDEYLYGDTTIENGKKRIKRA